jgi:predicted PhzF superfamily epimerase YddE/YHI9
MAVALGVAPARSSRARVGFLVEVETPDAVCAVQPDFGRLADLESVVVTSAAAADDDHDFVSRYFASRYGIDEDPVTGAAHCALAPYWAERFGRDELLGYQASARGGTVAVRLRGDRVVLGGRATTVARGELLVTTV